MTDASITALPVAPSLLGESPLWHPDEACLYWVDIPGHRLNRFDPASDTHRAWDFPTEPACCVPLLGGGLLLAMRDGLWRLDTATDGAQRQRVAAPPYDPAQQRYNDGKADAQGRLWVGTLDDARRPEAALYRHAGGRTERMADGITTSNGLAFSPDGRTMYWSDTKAHEVQAFDFNGQDGSLSRQRSFARFAPRTDGAPLTSYGGRPDGAAVDSLGRYWVAMYEGRQLLCLAPDGSLVQAVPLPVQCPTMCSFGDADLKTLYITTGRHGRPADELAKQPLAGCVLRLRVDVPGLPAHIARL